MTDPALEELARQQRIANIIALTAVNFLTINERKDLARLALKELDV